VTATHLYGVLDSGILPAPSARGLDGRAVRALPAGIFSAWVSDVPEARLEATPQRLRQHDAVLRDAVAGGYSVVPSLFGRLHPGDSALIASIDASAAAIGAAMALVRDRVEMSFLVTPSRAELEWNFESPQEALGPGSEHLRRIRRQVHAERNLRELAAALAQTTTRELGDLIVAERVVENPAPPIIVARAHLVTRANIARYLQAIKSKAEAADQALRVAVRGPGAAYSFAAVQIG
jgi:hypothetical protein